MRSQKVNGVELNLSASEGLRVEFSLPGFRTLVPWSLGTEDLGLNCPPSYNYASCVWQKNAIIKVTKGFFIIIFFYWYITLWGEKGSGLSEIFFSGITHFFKKTWVK